GHHPPQQIETAQAAKLRVGVGKVRPEVPQARRAEEGVGQGVTDDVTVRVAVEAELLFEQLAAQVQPAGSGAPVQVEAQAESNAGHSGESVAVRARRSPPATRPGEGRPRS